MWIMVKVIYETQSVPLCLNLNEHKIIVQDLPKSPVKVLFSTYQTGIVHLSEVRQSQRN